MDNKQLLERAARAAGIAAYWGVDGTVQNRPLFVVSAGGRMGTMPYEQEWNPIKNDADAFRLMVDCNIDVVQSRHEVFATAYDWEKMERGEPFTELFPDHNNDKHAATRMAIVRAAAKSQENT